jgi:hypothetical protein
MARSRRVLDRGTLVAALLCLAALMVVTGQVALSNGVIGERAAISDLRADRAYLQARLGILERDWNERTSREEIVVKAAEIGLVAPARPSVLLVLDESRRDDGPSFLRRAMAAVGAREAHAAVGGDGP